MSWRDPTPFENAILADTEARWGEIIPLARHLILAPRIEPLLLRNVRRHFVPTAQVEIESLLWFSPLVAARSTREIVFHQGIAKALADSWRPADDPPRPPAEKALEALWQFTRRHTRHWKPEDRLERDLRYYALLGDRLRLQAGLRDILRQIGSETSEDQRIAWSRMVKRTLPIISPRGQRVPDEARLLAQFAALALGDAGSWAQPGEPQALPAWLAAKLPSPIAQAALGLEIRQDRQHGQLLHLVAPDPSVPSIEFPSPLPARLYVAAEGHAGTWHSVTVGSRIPITPPSRSLRLITLEGRQWDLRADTVPDTGNAGTDAPAPLVLIYVETDLSQAHAIAEWLKRQGMAVNLQPESVSIAGAGTSPAQARIVRLWTRAAQAYWQQRTPAESDRLDTGLLLRTEPVELPTLGGSPGHVLDWQDWASPEKSAEVAKLLEQLRRWQTEGEIDTAVDAGRTKERQPTDDPAVDAEGVAHELELKKLLAEIEDPATTPPRRLEIGDRLAEIGDPRPGVGVVEIEVPVQLAKLKASVPLPSSLEDLVTILDSDDPNIQIAATEAIRSILLDANLDARKKAAMELGSIGPRAMKSLPILIDLVNDTIGISLRQPPARWGYVQDWSGSNSSVIKAFDVISTICWALGRIGPVEKVMPILTAVMGQLNEALALCPQDAWNQNSAGRLGPPNQFLAAAKARESAEKALKGLDEPSA